MMLTFPWMPSSFVGCANIATLAHRDAVRRAHPLHQSPLRERPLRAENGRLGASTICNDLGGLRSQKIRIPESPQLGAKAVPPAASCANSGRLKQSASTPWLGLPMSAGCAMWVRGGETIVGARGEGDPEVPVLNQREGVGGRQVRQSIAREAA